MRHKQHPTSLEYQTVCVCVAWTGTKTRSQKSCTITVVVFPWWASLWSGCTVLSRAISVLFPTPCTDAANKEMRGDKELMLGTRN